MQRQCTRGYWRRRRAIIVAVLLASLMTLLAPRSVRADDVFGTVKLDGAVVRGGTLEVRRERSPDGVIEVTIGQNGGYRIFLEPGRYTVRLKAREPSAPEIVNSMPAPIRLDLNFRRPP